MGTRVEGLLDSRPVTTRCREHDDVAGLRRGFFGVGLAGRIAETFDDRSAQRPVPFEDHKFVKRGDGEHLPRGARANCSGPDEKYAHVSGLSQVGAAELAPAAALRGNTAAAAQTDNACDRGRDADGEYGPAQKSHEWG